MMSFYETVWPDIIEKRGFSMRSPATNGPYILEAMRKAIPQCSVWLIWLWRRKRP